MMSVQLNCKKRLYSLDNTESKKDLLWIWWGWENDVLWKRDGEPKDKSMEDRGAETGQLEIPLHKKRADILTEILPSNLRHIQKIIIAKMTTVDFLEFFFTVKI